LVIEPRSSIRQVKSLSRKFNLTKMYTNYKKEIVSPIQLKNRPYDIKDNRVVQEEIEKNLRSYQ